MTKETMIAIIDVMDWLEETEQSSVETVIGETMYLITPDEMTVVVA